MPLDRREMLVTLATGVATGSLGWRSPSATPDPAVLPAVPPLRRADDSVDWRAVRDLFPLRRDWLHFATFLFVSHPRPVAERIEYFRRKIDADSVWIEIAALTDAEGRPYQAVKAALASYLGGRPDEICLTSNTTSALAMAYHGLKIRADQEIVTTEHDHYVHHESIRFAAERSRCGVRRVTMYDAPAAADADQMVARIAEAITPRTRAVGATWVHSSTGVKVPVKQIAEVVAKANVGRAEADRCLLIVDGVHGFGTQDVEVAQLGCDFFASGTHKWLFAPRGTGFLWGRSDVWPNMRPTIPTFDPDCLETWAAWMNRTPLPPTRAGYLSPGGFLAYEHLLAVPAAVQLHEDIGRDNIASRIADLNRQFREGAATIGRVTLHTPRDPSISGGISCFAVDGSSPDDVVARLAAKQMRASASPYKVSYARVAAGIMNFPDEIDAVLGEIRAIAG